MRQLPKNQRYADWIVTVFTLVGMAITLLLVDVREVIKIIFTFLSGVPYYYIAGAFMLFPLIAMVVLFCVEKEKIFVIDDKIQNFKEYFCVNLLDL